MVWCYKGSQQPLRQQPLGHVVEQVGMMDEPTLCPSSPPHLFTSGNIYSNPSMHLHGELESWHKITDNDADEADLLQLLFMLQHFFKMPDRASLSHVFYFFQEVAYQLDFSKVVLLYIILNFIVVTLTLTSLDHSQISSKVGQMSMIVQVQINP
jgi:hypothetical protein